MEKWRKAFPDTIPEHVSAKFGVAGSNGCRDTGAYVTGCGYFFGKSYILSLFEVASLRDLNSDRSYFLTQGTRTGPL